ncbi:MAG: ATP synthase F1 subunit delta, partial [Pseudomonadota bacterium]
MSTSTVSANHAPVSDVAGRYATALFDLAGDAGVIDAVEDELKSLQASISGAADFSAFLYSPVYDREAQVSAMTAIAERAGVSALTANFLKLIARNRRLSELEGMIRAYRALAASHRGEVGAEAITAAPMTDDQVKALRLEIERMVGKAVNL